MKTEREIIIYIRTALQKLRMETDSVKTHRFCLNLIPDIDHYLKQIDDEIRDNVKTKREIIEYIRTALQKIEIETDSLKTHRFCQDLIQSIDHDLREIALKEVEDYFQFCY